MPHVVTFSGEYDLSCKEELRTQLDALHNEPALVLDLSEVTYLDSSVLSELVRLHDARKKHGFPKEILVIPSGSVVERLFAVVGMAPLFEVVKSVGEIDHLNDDTLDSDFRCIS